MEKPIIPSRVKAWRALAGLSHSRLASQLGISESHLRNLVGRRVQDPRAYDALVAALGPALPFVVGTSDVLDVALVLRGKVV